MLIPVTGSNVDLSLLHPRFKLRLEAFFADARIKGRVAVVSACRTYAQQKWLYDRYKSGRGNLAANPDWHRPDGFFKGSFHQVQDDGFCYAVDFKLIGGGLKEWEVSNIAKSYGLYPTVKSEWWHHQPRDGIEWFNAPLMVEDKCAIRELKADWAGVSDYLSDLSEQVKKTPIRIRERSDRVKCLQSRLGASGHDAGIPDGIFGRKTRKAVRSLQRASELKSDGVVGPDTWKALWL